MEEGKLLIPLSHLIDWDITKIKKLEILYALGCDHVSHL